VKQNLQYRSTKSPSADSLRPSPSKTVIIDDSIEKVNDEKEFNNTIVDQEIVTQNEIQIHTNQTTPNIELLNPESIQENHQGNFVTVKSCFIFMNDFLFDF